MDLGLQDRPALVAAASRGLGFACARALAGEGARVALCSRTRDAAREAAERIRSETGSTVVALEADVSTAEGATGFVRSGAEELGGCHILVANAGGPKPGRAVDMSDREWLDAVELNFLSTVRMAREALPHMRRAGHGRIVAIMSSAVKEPITNLALSNSARAAATGFLKTLGREVAAEGITVNAILPGRILTDRIRRLAAERAGSESVAEEEALAQQAVDVPMGRLGLPEEVGEVAAFLASERASYLTGCMLSVDGGMLRSLF
jgi:3-oxoacyl-[acyl-carrier protein] reductase